MVTIATPETENTDDAAITENGVLPNLLDETSDEEFICAECNRQKPTDEARMLNRGGAVCETCTEKHNYISCEECLYYFRFTELRLTCAGCPRQRNCHQL